jgi:cyclin D5
VVTTDEMMPVEAAAAAAADDWSECAFSLTCEEDCADLGDGVVDDGEFFPLYNAGDEEEEEYLEQLVFKETSFCSSSSSDSAADCDGDGDGDGDGEGDEEYPSLASEEWFRQARLAAVKWILEVSPD